MNNRLVEGFNGNWFLPDLIDKIRETQSFTHLSDSVIKGWVLGRLELEIFGEKERVRSFCVTVKCPKCRGRGWYGLGRPSCPECVGSGLKPLREERRWKEPIRFGGYENRVLHESMYLLGITKKRNPYLERFEQMVKHRTYTYPPWVDDVVISGSYSAEQKERFFSDIVFALSCYKDTPKVRGEPLRENDIKRRLIHHDLTTGADVWVYLPHYWRICVWG